MCRTWFAPRRRDQAYCSTRCNDAGFKLEIARGRRIYRAIYHWRLWVAGRGRINVAKNFLFMCREVASWIREDRDAQRLPPPPHDHDSDRGHQRPAKLPTVKPGKANP